MVVTGKEYRPPKIFNYGIEGTGKSTLAAQAPNPVFLDTEDRLSHLDVNKIRCNDAYTLEKALDYVLNADHFYQTLVLDTLDWAVEFASNALCKKHGMKGIEDFGYGNGYVYLYEEAERIKNRLDEIRAKHGMMIWINGHARVEKFSDPLTGCSYDRYTTKTRDKGKTNISAMFREWADCVFFSHYETLVVEDKDKVMRAQGGVRRVLGTAHTAAYDAKNSYSMPSIVDMSWAALSQYLEIKSPTSSAAESQATSPAKTHLPSAAADVSQNTGATSTGDDMAERKELQAGAIQLAIPLGGKEFVASLIRDRGINLKTIPISEFKFLVEEIREMVTTHIREKEGM